MFERSIVWKDFENLPISRGRNGSIITTGLIIHAVGKNSAGPGFVDVKPFTKRGKVGNCVLALPTHPKTLRFIAMMLNEVAAELEKGK
jgi:hypothetical protein